MLRTCDSLSFISGGVALALCLLKLSWFFSLLFYKAIDIVFNKVLIPITDLGFVLVSVFAFNAYLGALITS